MCSPSPPLLLLLFLLLGIGVVGICICILYSLDVYVISCIVSSSYMFALLYYMLCRHCISYRFVVGVALVACCCCKSQYGWLIYGVWGINYHE